ncbi:MAG: ribosome biogenesis GTP-binding protein YihA/YsxC [Bacteroidales bacterium]|nr:ribosome biogenesis GTP-binding protein YihA/YsxC [Bacteroidales bacterium]MDD4669893.1 ribosome biogenesis GTP-binding protein YihA/YsxC [Bacteroidales bacterium]
MNIIKAVFAGSSENVTQKPKALHPEFAFIGRSNVGKSSLINCLCSQKKLAHTSSTPGKTRLVNHFLINDDWYLVDLPGYGYAKIDKKSKGKLDIIVKDYIDSSEEMVLLFVLLDSRHDIQKIDLDFLIKLGEEGIPFSIIFTKCDKSGTNALNTQIDKNKAELMKYWEELPPVFLSSAETGRGRDEILKYIEETLYTLKSL